jgi:hypothetical protein
MLPGMSQTKSYLKRSTKDTFQLIKNTFVLIGKNHSILEPTFKQFIWLFSMLFSLVIAIVIAIVGAVLDNSAVTSIGVLAIVLLMLFMIFFMPFLFIYYKAAQCWIVYKTLKGESASYKDGINRAKKNKMDIFWIGFIGMIVRAVQSQLRSGKGILGMLARMVASAVGEAWDLVSNYILPGGIIEDNTSVWQAARNLKEIKNNIPGALVGVFGIDIIGRGIMGYFLIAPILLLIAAVIIGFVTKFFWHVIVFVILLLLTAFIGSILVGMVKTIYFTIFYVTLSRPMDVAEKYRTQMTHYLNFEEIASSMFGAVTKIAQPAAQPAVQVQSADNSAKAQSPAQPVVKPVKSEPPAVKKVVPSKEENKEPVEVDDKTYGMLAPYLKKYYGQGKTDDDIVKFLAENKWPENIVRACMAKYKK